MELTTMGEYMNIFGLYEFREAGDVATSIITPDGGGIEIAAAHLRAALVSEHSGTLCERFLREVAGSRIVPGGNRPEGITTHCRIDVIGNRIVVDMSLQGADGEITSIPWMHLIDFIVIFIDSEEIRRGNPYLRWCAEPASSGR